MENNSMLGRNTLPMGSMSSPGLGGGVAEGEAGSDPSPAAVRVACIGGLPSTPWAFLL